MKSKKPTLTEILENLLIAHWHHLGIEPDDYGCKECLKLVDKTKQSILELLPKDKLVCGPRTENYNQALADIRKILSE